MVVRACNYHKPAVVHITVLPTPERRSQKCEGLAWKHVEESRMGLGAGGGALDGGLDATPWVIGVTLSQVTYVNRMRLVALRDP